MSFNSFIKPAIISCLLPLAMAAHAEDYNFVTLKMGVDQPMVTGSGDANIASAKTTYVGGIEIGRKLTEIFSLSAEYNYKGKSDFVIPVNTTNSLTYNWSSRSDTFMVNVMADLIQDSKITPYAKLGLGASINRASDYKQIGDTSITYTGKNSTNFAWQAGVGLNLATASMFDTDVAYNFINRGKVSTRAVTVPAAMPAKTTTIQDHVFTIGIKMKF